MGLLNKNSEQALRKGVVTRNFESQTNDERTEIIRMKKYVTEKNNF